MSMLEEEGQGPLVSSLGTSCTVSESAIWKDVLSRVKHAMAQSELVLIDPSKIRPMEGQPRKLFSETAMASLCQSIRKVGQIQAGIVRRVPVDVAGVEYEILDGERRWRAVMAEGVSHYRAQLVEIDDDAAPYMVAAIANFNREGHTPMEISDAIHQLHTGLVCIPMVAIAEMFGFSVNWTYQMHGLQNLHPSVRAMLDPSLPREKFLPVTAAVHISRLDPSVQVELAHRVVSKDLSLAQLRHAIIEIGKAQGKEIKPRVSHVSKLIASFETRLFDTEVRAENLLLQMREIQSRHLLPRIAEHRRELLASLEITLRDLAIVRDAL